MSIQGPPIMPVARLRAQPSKDFPETTFLLYPGVTSIGKEGITGKNHLALPYPDMLDRHISIECDGNGLILARILGEEQTATIGGITMRSDVWYEMTPGRRIHLVGLLSLSLEEMSKDERMAKIGLLNKSSQEGTRGAASASSQSKLIGNSRTSQSRYSDTAPTQLVPVHRAEEHDDAENVPEDDSIPCTLSMAEVTISLTDDSSDYGSNPEALNDAYPPTLPLERPGMILPPEISRNRNPLSSDLPPTLPYGSLGDDMSGPSQDYGRNYAATYSDQNYDADAPTQLLDPRDQTELFEQSEGTESFNRSAITSKTGNDHLEATQIIGVQVEAEEESEERPEAAAKVTNSLDIVSETQPTQLIGERSEKLEESSIGLERNAEAPNSLPEIVSETQASQRDETKGSRSQRHSRQTSLEPMSQEVSQFLSAEQHTSRIPSTPVELQNQQHSTQEGPGDQVQNEEDVDNDGAPKAEGNEVGAEEVEKDDEAEKIPSTPEDRIHGTMSEVSTLEPAAPEGLSIEASVDVMSVAPVKDDSGKPDKSDAKKEADTLVKDDGKVQEQLLSDLGFNSITEKDKEAESDQALEEAEEKPQGRKGNSVSRKSSNVSDTIKRQSFRTNRAVGESRGLLDDKKEEGGEEGAISSPAKEGSPKHHIDSDSGKESSPRPPKMKKESTAGTFDRGASEQPSGRSRARIPRSNSTLEAPVMNPNVALSAPGMDAASKRSLTAIVERLNGKVKSSVEDATVLALEGKRTSKMMCAIVKGVPIVTMDWLRESGKLNKFQSLENYLFADPELEQEYGVSLQAAIDSAKVTRDAGISLFGSYDFYFVTNPGDPAKGFISSDYVASNLAPIVAACRGKIIKKPMHSKDPLRETIVIGSNPACKETAKLISMGFKVVSKEFLTSTIIHQTPDFLTFAIDQPVKAEQEDQDHVGLLSEPTTHGAASSSSRIRAKSVTTEESRASTVDRYIGTTADEEEALPKAKGKAKAKAKSRARKVNSELSGVQTHDGASDPEMGVSSQSARSSRAASVVAARAAEAQEESESTDAPAPVKATRRKAPAKARRTTTASDAMATTTDADESDAQHTEPERAQTPTPGKRSTSSKPQAKKRSRK